MDGRRSQQKNREEQKNQSDQKSDKDSKNNSQTLDKNEKDNNGKNSENTINNKDNKDNKAKDSKDQQNEVNQRGNHSKQPSIGSRPQSKLSHLKEVIEKTISLNSKRSSKLKVKILKKLQKVDQNRDLIDLLRRDLQSLAGEFDMLKKKSLQSAVGSPVKQPSFAQQNTFGQQTPTNSQLQENSKHSQNIKELFNQNQDLSDQIANLMERVQDLENMMRDVASNTELEQLRKETENMADTLNETSAQSKDNAVKIKDLKRMLENQQKMVAQSHSGNDSTLNLTLNEHIHQNNNSQQSHEGQGDFDAKLKGLKDYLIALMKALKEDIDRKPTFEDLQKSEAYNLEKLDEVAGALINKLADKGDTKKALQHLEKKINQIYLILAREGGGEHGTEDDGLVVKRPLLWSCISCDKHLDKYNGRLGDYKAWKIMPPKETSPERIGKFGRGWKANIEKKMKLNTDRMNTEYSNNSTDNIQQTQLPKINRNRGQSHNEEQV